MSESEVIIPRRLYVKATKLVATGVFKSVEQVTESAVQEFLDQHTVTIPSELHAKAKQLVDQGLFKSVEQVTEKAVQDYLREHWDPKFTSQP